MVSDSDKPPSVRPKLNSCLLGASDGLFWHSTKRTKLAPIRAAVSSFPLTTQLVNSSLSPEISQASLLAPKVVLFLKQLPPISESGFHQ